MYQQQNIESKQNKKHEENNNGKSKKNNIFIWVCGKLPNIIRKFIQAFPWMIKDEKYFRILLHLIRMNYSANIVKQISEKRLNDFTKISAENAKYKY